MSGMRPTGKLHIGHLLGALENWRKLQDSYDCYYSVADWHALTTGYRATESIPESIREMALDWLACGLDPAKSTLFVQSHIPEIAELHLLLSMIIPTAWLERVPTYKDQLQELLKQRMGGRESSSKQFLQELDNALQEALIAYNTSKDASFQDAQQQLNQPETRAFQELLQEAQELDKGMQTAWNAAVPHFPRVAAPILQPENFHRLQEKLSYFSQHRDTQQAQAILSLIKHSMWWISDAYSKLVKRYHAACNAFNVGLSLRDEQNETLGEELKKQLENRTKLFSAILTGLSDTAELQIDKIYNRISEEDLRALRNTLMHLKNSHKTLDASLEEREAREEAAKRGEMEYLATYGFLGYPLLQTADIIVVKGEVVPVGQDQLPHLELAREVVRRFHFIFKKEIFPEPEGLLSEAPFVPGIDGRKMSKSYDNGILISDPPEVIEQKAKKTITDPQKIRKGDPGHPEVCNIFFYHRFFSPEPLLKETEANCKTGALGCVDCKKNLSKVLIEKLAPVRETRAKLSENPKALGEILNEGAKKTRAVAAQTLGEMNEVMHL